MEVVNASMAISSTKKYLSVKNVTHHVKHAQTRKVVVLVSQDTQFHQLHSSVNVQQGHTLTQSIKSANLAQLRARPVRLAIVA